jgi:hypothetical protein
MATHETSILRHVNPDTTGQVWREPYSLKATNDVWKQLVWILNDDDATRAGLYGLFKVPNNFVGSASICIYWTAQVTTGNAVFDFEYRAVGGNDAESMDQSGTQESVTVTDAAPSAVNRELLAEISLTSGNFAAGDLVSFFLAIDGADGACTISDYCTLFEATFKYADV